MPWSPEDFRNRHNKKFGDRQAGRAASVANSVLKRTGDEGQAVRAGNAAGNEGRQYAIRRRLESMRAKSQRS